MRAGTWWGRWLGVIIVGYVLAPAFLVLGGNLLLPEHNSSGQCEGLGFGCVLAPNDGILLLGLLWVYAVPVVLAVTFVVLALLWAAIPHGTGRPLPPAWRWLVGTLALAVILGPTAFGTWAIVSSL
ncbi:hypothetical protein [Mumia quercus]|uniref:hypothetical protein n=1 Tax=Mumia quercus TaxID=2976125 RepID=UPI0021D0BA8B|nr:hypothetical protein [Mumia quercus]